MSFARLGFFSGEESVTFFDVNSRNDITVPVSNDQEYSLLRNVLPIQPFTSNEYRSPALSRDLSGVDGAVVAVLLSDMHFSQAGRPGLRLSINSNPSLKHDSSRSIYLNLAKDSVELYVRTNLAAQISLQNQESTAGNAAYKPELPVGGFFVRIHVNLTANRTIESIQPLSVTGSLAEQSLIISRTIVLQGSIADDKFTASSMASDWIRFSIIDDSDVWSETSTPVSESEIRLAPTVLVNTSSSEVYGYVTAKRILQLPQPSPSPSSKPSSSPSISLSTPSGTVLASPPNVISSVRRDASDAIEYHRFSSFIYPGKCVVCECSWLLTVE
jgi:hypothetical protein